MLRFAFVDQLLVKKHAFKRSAMGTAFLITILAISYFLLLSGNATADPLPSCTESQFDESDLINYQGELPNPNINCLPANCSDLDNATANTPNDDQDGANCFYMGLPPCSGVTDPEPRINCAELTDLPLCESFPVDVDISGVNCVDQCPPNEEDTIGFSHNINCVRFCEGVNKTDSCSIKQCHQLTADSPDPNSNCEILSCNLLTLEELKVDDRFFASEGGEENKTYKKYCEGDTKCYDLRIADVNQGGDPENLQYFRSVRGKGDIEDTAMCQLHNCTPTSSYCGVDEAQLFVIGRGDNFFNNYDTYISLKTIDGENENGGVFEVCNPLDCESIVTTEYICSNSSSNLPTILHADCDDKVPCLGLEDGCGDDDVLKNQQCNEKGLCIKIIDCNDLENIDASECIQDLFVEPPPEPEYEFGEDTYQSWYYRPSPPARDVSDGKLKHPEQLISDGEMCYSTTEMKDNKWGGDLKINTIFGSINLGYFHNGLANTISPSKCNTQTPGFRGIGYANLCGTTGSIWNLPSNGTAYIRGSAVSNYNNSSGAIHEIVSCVRYKNSGRLSACGKRECGIDCLFGSCTQWCGWDICKTLIVQDENPRQCAFDTNVNLISEQSRNDTNYPESKFPNGLPGCVKEVGDFIHDVGLRAVKYGRNICVIMDQSEVYGHEDHWMDGTESLTNDTDDPRDDYCIEGVMDGSGNCSGHNSNGDVSSLDDWRAIRVIPYVSNNQGVDAVSCTVLDSINGKRISDGAQCKGYYDANDKFFLAQECARVPLLIDTPGFYQVATIESSPYLFLPLLHVSGAFIKKGGELSEPEFGNTYGKTDFYEPELEVTFGDGQFKFGLEVGEIETPEPVEISITTDARIEPYIAKISVKKEYNYVTKQPLLCAYHHMDIVEGGETIDPINIGCIDRVKPDIIAENSEMKVAIKGGADNAFNDVSIKVSLVTDLGTNGANDGCAIGSDDACLPEANLSELIFESENDSGTNFSFDKESCTTQDQSDDIDKYEICVKRDECSELVYECAIDGAELTHPQCFGAKLLNCNAKFGINDPICDGAPCSDFLSQIELTQNLIVDPNYQNFRTLFKNGVDYDDDAYGWHNEACITKGFESKLRDVMAPALANGSKGKCTIDEAKSLYMSDDNPDTNCNDGGKAPYCVCQEGVSGLPGVRKETLREAGLCIDIPLPKFCSAINHGSSDNWDFPAVDSESLEGIKYCDDVDADLSNCIDPSHRDRAEDENYGHAEFPSVIAGTVDVEGSCNGFWKQESGRPKISCNAQGEWENLQNECTRKTCPIKYSFSGDNVGLIGNHYEIISYDNGLYNLDGQDLDIDKGSGHGFADWPASDSNGDFPIEVIADSCLPGFKKINSIYNPSAGLYENDNEDDSPYRYCKPDGNWSEVLNSCERIYCEAQEVPLIEDYGNNFNDWLDALNAWAIYNKGATFPQGVASRSSIIGSGESFIGECDIDLGFSEVGGNTPSRKCNYQGIWEDVINPCAQSCVALDDGNASWLEANPGPLETIDVVGLCLDGHEINPYTESEPTRQCASVFISSQNGFVGQWQEIVGPCVNSCLGDDNANISQLVSGTSAALSWSEESQFGDYSVEKYGGSCSNIGPSAYANPDSACYILGRVCGNGSNTSFGTSDTLLKGKYDPNVQSLCPGSSASDLSGTYDGTIGNALYNDNVVGSEIIKDPAYASYGGEYNNFLVAGSNDYIIGQCRSINGVQYWPKGSVAGNIKDGTNGTQDVRPRRECKYNGNGNVDEVYLGLVSGYEDCEPVTCSVSNGDTFGSGSIYNGSATSYTHGTTIELDCKADYGKKITSPLIYRDPPSTETNICGSQAYDGMKTDRMQERPTITCQADGTWSFVSNDCSTCNRNCPATTGFVSNRVYGNPKCFDPYKSSGDGDCYGIDGYSIPGNSKCDGGDSGDDEHYNNINSGNSMSHDQYWSYCQKQNRQGSSSAAIGIKCIDSRYYSVSHCIDNKNYSGCDSACDCTTTIINQFDLNGF